MRQLRLVTIATCCCLVLSWPCSAHRDQYASGSAWIHPWTLCPRLTDLLDPCRQGHHLVSIRSINNRPNDAKTPIRICFAAGIFFNLFVLFLQFLRILRFYHTVIIIIILTTSSSSSISISFIISMLYINYVLFHCVLHVNQSLLQFHLMYVFLYWFKLIYNHCPYNIFSCMYI